MPTMSNCMLMPREEPRVTIASMNGVILFVGTVECYYRSNTIVELVPQVCHIVSELIFDNPTQVLIPQYGLDMLHPASRLVEVARRYFRGNVQNPADSMEVDCYGFQLDYVVGTIYYAVDRNITYHSFHFCGKAKEFDLPLNIHPAAIRASAGFTPWGACGATCDRRSWSGLRRRSHVAERLAA
jgi:hypothetical protein